MKKEKIIDVLIILLLLVFIFSIYAYTTIFRIGLHNIDLVMNLAKDDDKFFNNTDISNTGEEHTLHYYYNLGFKQINFSFLMFGVAYLGIGLLINIWGDDDCRKSKENNRTNQRHKK